MTISAPRCPVCLSDSGLADATRCSSCLVPFHRECVAGHAVAAAERGQLPLRCPIPECASPWGEAELSALNPAELERYERAMRATEELREGCAPAPLSPRLLASLGLRPCPQCHVLIQKQPEGLLSGCDKMTCRCGCMFCFRCGMEAREGGVSRCRCVGAHHSFIPRSQVLENYAGVGARDEDLARRGRKPAMKQALARLHKERAADLPPFVHARCTPPDMLHWNFVLEGPPGTPYEGGWYWGRVELPGDYPFAPPLIRVVTPSGRFEADRWLCRSIFDYHPEGWQPTWTLPSVLLALLALMCEDCFTAGAIHPPLPREEQRRLALASLDWNRQQPGFLKAFPDIDCLVAKSFERHGAQVDVGA